MLWNFNLRENFALLRMRAHLPIQSHWSRDQPEIPSTEQRTIVIGRVLRIIWGSYPLEFQSAQKLCAFEDADTSLHTEPLKQRPTRNSQYWQPEQRTIVSGRALRIIWGSYPLGFLQGWGVGLNVQQVSISAWVDAWTARSHRGISTIHASSTTSWKTFNRKKVALYVHEENPIVPLATWSWCHWNPIRHDQVAKGRIGFPCVRAVFKTINWDNLCREKRVQILKGATFRTE